MQTPTHLTVTDRKEDPHVGIQKARDTIRKWVQKDVIEKYLYNASVSQWKKGKRDIHSFEELYRSMCYDYLSERPEECWAVTKKDSLSGSFGWSSGRFNNLQKEQEEEDAFIANPIEIEEGVVTCGKCGSNKTYSYQLQTRSGDEGITSFVRCVQCGSRWKM